MDYCPSLFSAKNENQEIGLAFILKSMTEQQQKIVRLIAKKQLESAESRGIEWKAFAEECIEQMFGISAKSIKDSLHEAQDHKIVMETTNSQGKTVVYMPYPPLVLQKIADDNLEEH